MGIDMGVGVGVHMCTHMQQRCDCAYGHICAGVSIIMVFVCLCIDGSSDVEHST